MAGPWFETSLCLSLPIQVTTMYPVSNNGVLAPSNENYGKPAVKEGFGFYVEATNRAHGSLGWLRMVSTRRSHSCLSPGCCGVLLLSLLLWQPADISDERRVLITEMSRANVTKKKPNKWLRRNICGKEQYDEELLTEPAWETWENFTLRMVITVTSVTLRQ